MTGPLVVAIDNGSQSTKVRIVDAHGGVHAEAQVALRPYLQEHPGRVVHPDDDVWEATRLAIREALEQFSGPLADIAGVGLCTIRFCRALVRADGTLAEPMWSWMDERVAQPHVPSTDVDLVTTSSGYLTLRLTGERRDTRANYEGAWPLHADTMEWLPDAALANWGVERRQLSELVDPGAELGRVTEAASLATGLPAGLPVFASANDKAVEALGAGLVRPTDIVLSLGTYICALALAPRSVPSSLSAGWLNSAALPGQRLLETHGIRRGMWTISWLRDRLNEGGGSLTDAELSQLAESVPIGANGLVTLLDWLPDREHPHRRGAFLGFDGSQTGPELFRSVCEAIAITMRDHVDAAARETGQSFDRIILTGGGSRSPLLQAIVANVFERPVLSCTIPDAAGIGAAICAFIGLGVVTDWAVAAGQLVSWRDQVHPEPAAVEAYRSVRSRYAAVRGPADALFDALAGEPR